MRRRQFLAATAAAGPATLLNPAPARASRASRVLLVIPGAVPEAARPRLAVRGTWLARAYSACPDLPGGRDAILSGCLPHAGAPPLVPRLESAGWQVTVTADLGAALAWAASPAGICAVAPISGDGANTHRSARVPLFAGWPERLAPGASTTQEVLFSTIDLMPTLLGLCGAEVPEGLHGRDLSLRLSGGNGTAPESIYAYGALGTSGEWRMVVRGLDKLVVDARTRPTHLYNLGQDPEEQTNLAADPAHLRTRDELAAHLREWMKRTGDRMDPSGLKLRG